LTTDPGSGSRTKTTSSRCSTLESISRSNLHANGGVGVVRSPIARRRLGGAYARHGEKLRFLVVGLGNTCLGYAIFLLLLAALGPRLHVLESSPLPFVSPIGKDYYVLVQWVAWVVCVPLSTLTMRYFAFRSTGHRLRQIGRAYFVYLPAQVLSALLLWLTVHVAHVSPQVGQLVAIAFATVFSYLGHKYFTFKTPVAV
jgi:hypothetical protein